MMKAIFSRRTSIDNAVQGVQESLSLNTTILINGGWEEIEYYIRRGMEDEATY